LGIWEDWIGFLIGLDFFWIGFLMDWIFDGLDFFLDWILKNWMNRCMEPSLNPIINNPIQKKSNPIFPILFVLPA